MERLFVTRNNEIHILLEKRQNSSDLIIVEYSGKDKQQKIILMMSQ